MRSLVDEGVKTLFGYPGGAIMPVYDALYDYRDRLNHILVRHEQAATHAAEGFARVSGEVGVCLVTSGPGATNTVTGVADAMMDSTPIVVITGQVAAQMLGSDAFQECDVVDVMQPICKWTYQIRSAKDVAWAPWCSISRRAHKRKRQHTCPRKLTTYAAMCLCLPPAAPALKKPPN